MPLVASCVPIFVFLNVHLSERLKELLYWGGINVRSTAYVLVLTIVQVDVTFSPGM
jgi:hypothetical protein